jgi:spore coat polysaccharide biosynthesis predicted glycosyltransferase SpsG
MRCLALADELRRRGVACRFICCERPGDLIDEIRSRGYPAHTLMEVNETRGGQETRAILAKSASTLIVADHYSLGQQWESTVGAGGPRVAAIDDLANRAHDCDIGRPKPRTHRSTLAVLQHTKLPVDCRITVVLGPRTPWVREVQEQATRLPWLTEVMSNPTCIAEVMVNSDLAIGAAGGTAWERCCLGLPSLIIAVAENQHLGVRALECANAGYNLGALENLNESLPQGLALLSRAERLSEMSIAASRLVDGLGAERVCQHLGDLLEHT